MTLDILIFLIILPYFVKVSQNELADYMKKHEIVKKKLKLELLEPL